MKSKIERLLPVWTLVSAGGFFGWALTRDPLFLGISVAALTGACAGHAREK